MSDNLDHIENAQFTDEDLNDPELLRELGLMSGSDGLPADHADPAEPAQDEPGELDDAQLADLMRTVDQEHAQTTNGNADNVDDLTKQMEAFAIPSFDLQASSTRTAQASAANHAAPKEKAVSKEKILSTTPAPVSSDAPVFKSTGSLSKTTSAATTSVVTSTAGLASQIQHQIDVCKTLSMNYFKSGDKELALTFHKLHKLFDTDCLLLSSPVPPTVNTVQVKYRYEKVNWDIGVNDIVVEIKKGFFGVVGEYYVAFTTNVGTPTSGEFVISGTTSTSKKSLDPEWNYKSKFVMPGPAAKTPSSVKNQVRFYERKKIGIEIYQPKGFFRKAELIGKLSVKLSDLVAHSEIHQVMDVMDPEFGKRPTGAKLEVQISIRNALGNREFVECKEKWIVLGDDVDYELFKEIDGTSGVPAPPTKVTPVAAAKAAQAAQVSKAAAASKPLVTAASPVKNVTAADDETIMLFESVQTIVSNNVLEQELETVTRHIEMSRSKLSPAALEELTEKKEQLDFKLKFLGIQVQTGQLTLEQYVQQLKASIAEHKKMALDFKKKGLNDYAKRALIRIKTMLAEIADVPSESAGEEQYVE